MATADLLSGLPRKKGSWWWRLAVGVAAIVVPATLAATALRHEAPSSIEVLEGPISSDEPCVSPPVAPNSSGERKRARDNETLAVGDWLERISMDAGKGLLVGPGVSGRVTGHFTDGLGWRERLAALSRVHGFSYRVDNGLIEVVAARDARHAESMGRDDEALLPAGGDRKVRNEAKGNADPDRCLEIVALDNGRAEDLVAVIADVLVAEGLHVTADVAANALVLEGPKTLVERARAVVSQLDVPRRRFLLETEIVELARTLRSELGVEWAVDGPLGALVDFSGSASEGEHGRVVVATTGVHSLRARLSALEANGRVRVVSRPRIVVVEHKEAEIESVRILRVRLPERTAIVEQGGQNAAPGRAVEEIPVGVSLRVRPSLMGDGRIAMQIEAKSSTLGRPQPPDLIPEELSRRIAAEVVVGDGETAVLGGLLREGKRHERAGIPVLRSVPVLGALFGRRSAEREGEELVVLVTPTLLE